VGVCEGVCERERERGREGEGERRSREGREGREKNLINHKNVENNRSVKQTTLENFMRERKRKHTRGGIQAEEGLGMEPCAFACS